MSLSTEPSVSEIIVIQIVGSLYDKGMAAGNIEQSPEVVHIIRLVALALVENIVPVEQGQAATRGKFPGITQIHIPYVESKIRLVIPGIRVKAPVCLEFVEVVVSHGRPVMAEVEIEPAPYVEVILGFQALAENIDVAFAENDFVFIHSHETAVIDFALEMETVDDFETVTETETRTKSHTESLLVGGEIIFEMSVNIEGEIFSVIGGDI